MNFTKLIQSAVLLFIIFFCATSSIYAQNVFDTLYSNILKENRKLEVIFPENYDANKKYDVIYVLDGEWNGQYTADLQNHMLRWQFMPENIIVGMHNTYIDGRNMRSRDMTPTQSQPNAKDGQAPNFVMFLKNELLPYINGKYPTTGNNTLFGHSHGGTCTMFTFLSEPQLFKSYIAVDPSFWWDNRYLSKLAAERLPKMQDVKASLHISGRAGDGYDGMGITTMDSVLSKHKPPGLIWESDAYKNEIHNSVKHKGLYDGLKLSYRGYSTESVEFHPQNGIVLKDQPTPIFMMDNPANIYYTVDGSDPSPQSMPLQQMNTITGSTTFKAKKFGFRSESKEITKGTFIEGPAIEAMTNTDNLKKGSMSYALYSGSNSNAALENGIAAIGFDLYKKLSDGDKTIEFVGYFHAQKEGAYIFAIDKEGIEAKVEVGDNKIIDTKSKNGVTSYTIPLKSGYHKIKLSLSNTKVNNFNLGFFYLNPGDTNPIKIEFEDFYTME